jgi:hypothetical protein
MLIYFNPWLLATIVLLILRVCSGTGANPLVGEFLGETIKVFYVVADKLFEWYGSECRID